MCNLMRNYLGEFDNLVYNDDKVIHFTLSGKNIILRSHNYIEKFH